MQRSSSNLGGKRRSRFLADELIQSRNGNRRAGQIRQLCLREHSSSTALLPAFMLDQIKGLARRDHHQQT